MKFPINGGLGFAILAILGFSLSVIFLKAAYIFYPEINFYSTAIWGWGSAMVGATFLYYLPFSRARKKVIPELKTHYKLHIIITLLALFNGLFWFYGLSVMSGGVVSLIDQNVFIWSFFLGILFLKEAFSAKEILAVGLTLLGLFIISTLEGEVTLLGILLLLMAGLSIALQSLVMKKYPQNFDALTLTFWRGWGLWFGSFLIALALKKVELSIPLGAFGLLFFSQFFGLFIGRGAYIKAHEFLPISQLSFMMLSIPVVVFSGTHFWLGEPITEKKLFGGVVMILGLVWFLWERERLKTANLQG